MKWHEVVLRYVSRLLRYASGYPGRALIAAGLVIFLVALCARCVPGRDFLPNPAGPEGATGTPSGGDPVAPGPAPAQVVVDSAGNALTLPRRVTLGVGQRDTFRVRLEGTGDHELVLFQVDTLAARFTPNWQVESRRGSLAPADWTEILAAAEVLHVEREHFGAGGFHEWSIPIAGKAVGKAQVLFLWQREDGSQRAHGSFDVEVLP